MGSLTPGWNTHHTPGIPPPGWSDTSGSTHPFLSGGHTDNAEQTERHLRPLKTTSMPLGLAGNTAVHVHDIDFQRDSSPGKQLSPSSRSLLSSHTMPTHSRYSRSSSNASADDHTGLSRSSMGHSSGADPLSTFSSERGSSHSSSHPAAAHSPWWTKMDSGRMNDEHISELHCEQPSLSHRLQGGEHVHSVSEQIVEIVRGLHPPTINEAGPS